MATKITHGQVEDFLGWARNYGEIIDYCKITDSGRCWMIEIEPGVRPMATDSPTGRGADLLLDFGGLDERKFVPEVMVLTTREALLFGYGLAVAGLSKRRTEFGDDDWHRPGPDTRCARWRRERSERITQEINERRAAYHRRRGDSKALPSGD